MYLSDLLDGTIFSEFNNTELDMDMLESQISKDSTWRNHLERHAVSGKSIAAFCRDKAISAGNFYAWRSKLRDGAAELSVAPRGATFIDLGGGVVLTIVRR